MLPLVLPSRKWIVLATNPAFTPCSGAVYPGGVDPFCHTHSISYLLVYPCLLLSSSWLHCSLFLHVFFFFFFFFCVCVWALGLFIKSGCFICFYYLEPSSGAWSFPLPNAGPVLTSGSLLERAFGGKACEAFGAKQVGWHDRDVWPV